MDEYLHNDNLEDFFRKSLKDFADNPDDSAWDNIAPFITTQIGEDTVGGQTNYLQNQVERLNRQNGLLKVLLGTIAAILICLMMLFYTPAGKQQVELSHLQKQLSQQKNTIHSLQNQIVLLSQQNSEKRNTSEIDGQQNTYLPNDLKENSNITLALNKRINESSNADKKATPILELTSKYPLSRYTNQQNAIPLNYFGENVDVLLHRNMNGYQKLIREEKTPLFSKNNFVNSTKVSDFDDPYTTLFIPSILLSFIEVNSLILAEAEQVKNHNLKPKQANEKSEKHKNIQLPSLNLKPIFDKLTMGTYLQIGRVENQFRYEDGLLEEAFFDFNGSFKEEARHTQYGLSLAYNINPQLSIQSGIGNLELQQNIEGIFLNGIYTTLNQNEELALKEQFYTSYSNNELDYTLSNVSQHFPNAEVGDTLQIPIKTEQAVKYISIPLAVKYTLPDKNNRLRLYLKAGINFNFLAKNELKIRSPHASFAGYQQIRSSGLEQIHGTYQLEGGLQYRVAPNFNILIAPYHIGSLSQATDNMPVLAYPSMNGIRLATSYDF